MVTQLRLSVVASVRTGGLEYSGDAMSPRPIASYPLHLRAPQHVPLGHNFVFPFNAHLFSAVFLFNILLFLSSSIVFNVISYLLTISCSLSPLTSLCALILTNCAAAGVAPGGPVPLTGGTRRVVTSILLPMVYISLPSALVRPRSLSPCYHLDLSAASFLWPCA